MGMPRRLEVGATRPHDDPPCNNLWEIEQKRILDCFFFLSVFYSFLCNIVQVKMKSWAVEQLEVAVNYDAI